MYIDSLGFGPTTGNVTKSCEGIQHMNYPTHSPVIFPVAQYSFAGMQQWKSSSCVVMFSLQVTMKIYLQNNVMYSGIDRNTVYIITLLSWHGNDTFQTSDSVILPFRYQCSIFSSGHMGAWVYFQRDRWGHVVSLTLPGLTYGVVYKKQQSSWYEQTVYFFINFVTVSPQILYTCHQTSIEC